MQIRNFSTWRAAMTGCCLVAVLGCGSAPLNWWWHIPEQRVIAVTDPADLPSARVPKLPAPQTVSTSVPKDAPSEMSLNDAIHIALKNSEVVRVLTGVSASSAGQTIYDTAIANTAIDEANAPFDPNLDLQNAWNRLENPVAVFDPFDRQGVDIRGTRTDAYNLDARLSKMFLSGGTAAVNVNETNSRFRPGLFPLNPQNRYFTEFSLTQPLLRGAGTDVNLAPIVVAQLDTERTYYQFKDSLQGLVRSVIDAYWGVVFARTDVWARRQQVEQGKFAFERAAAHRRRGLGDDADVAQTKVAFANFQASLISAEANLLNREAALRNILGLPPTVPARIVPVTPPSNERLAIDWDAIVDLAEERRPDLVQLKLIIESDRVQLRQARNFALPQVDAVALHRYNGLEGRTPTGARTGTGSDQFTDWTLGVNVTVPLGLRQSRAALRRREITLVRDRANLDQGVHNAVHILAASTRNLDQFYEQYEAFREVREAAEINLDVQSKKFGTGLSIFLNVLQAITDWGNSVSAEAQALAQYNAELANLERETGTILETHGVELYGDHFCSKGPCLKDRSYPLSIEPSDNADRYPRSDQPSENFFDLKEHKFDGDDDQPGMKRPLPIPPPPGLKSTLPAPAERSEAESGEGLFRSLVPQGVDGIESAGAAGGIEAEKDPDRSSE